jgi:hypothetical protein
MSGARRVALVAVTVAACALVAFASRGDRRTGDGAAFELGRGSATASGIAVIVITVLAIALLAWGLWRPDGPRRPPRRRSWRDTVIPIAIALLLAFALATQRPEPGRSGDATEPGSQVGPGITPGVEQPQGEGPSGTASILIALLAIAALSGAAAMARRRRDRVTPSGSDVSAGDGEQGAPALDALPTDALVRAVHDEPDDRHAILLAFAAAERLLATTPLARRATSSPREWLAHVRRAGDAGHHTDVVTAMGALVACYEVARFSDHAISARDRRRAVDALQVVAREADNEPTPVGR